MFDISDTSSLVSEHDSAKRSSRSLNMNQQNEALALCSFLLLFLSFSPSVQSLISKQDVRGLTGLFGLVSVLLAIAIVSLVQ